MRFEITMKIGEALQLKLSDEAKDEKDIFQKVSFFQTLPRQCGGCRGTDLALMYANRKGYDFYSLLCNSCGQELKMGQTKEGQRLFPKGWEAPHNQSGGGAPQGGDTPGEPPPGEPPQDGRKW